MVKAKFVCPMQRRKKEDGNELDKEIFKLHLFYDESVKQLYKRRVQKCIKISYEGSMQ
jgi:hypothetical protein